MYRSGLVNTSVNHTNTNGVWLNSLAWRPPWLHASSVKNKQTNLPSINKLIIILNIFSKYWYWMILLISKKKEKNWYYQYFSVSVVLIFVYKMICYFDLLSFIGWFFFGCLLKTKWRMKTDIFQGAHKFLIKLQWSVLELLTRFSPISEVRWFFLPPPKSSNESRSKYSNQYEPSQSWH
jgi:hypothetical protein